MTLTPEIFKKLRGLFNKCTCEIKFDGDYQPIASPACQTCLDKPEIIKLLLDYASPLFNAAEREMTRHDRQGTHWEGCWEVHGDCALALAKKQHCKIMRLEQKIVELEATVTSYGNLQEVIGSEFEGLDDATDVVRLQKQRIAALTEERDELFRSRERVALASTSRIAELEGALREIQLSDTICEVYGVAMAALKGGAS